MKKNLTLVFLIAVFYFQNVSATTYYWVPYGSGIWGKNTHVVADSSNWSTISGGKGNQGYPTSTDTAYFDANSFTIGHDSVLVSGNIAVHSIIFNTLGQKATFGNQTNADTVKLYGSFLLDTNVIFRANACGYVFYSYGSTVNQIDMKKNAFTSYYNNYAFNGNGAGWKLLSNLDMSASNIVFGTGAKFNTNGFDVYTINTTNADSVQITIKGPTLWTAQTLDFTGKGSTLAMDSNARFHIWFNTANGKMRAAGLNQI